MTIATADSLLTQVLDFDVDEGSVASLTTVELLLTSTNPAQPILIRQQAFGLYTVRKLVWDSGKSFELGQHDDDLTRSSREEEPKDNLRSRRLHAALF